MISWSLFLVGIIVLGLKNHSVLPVNSFTTFAVQIGSAVELSLISMNLGFLIRKEERKNTILEKEKSELAHKLEVSQAISQTTQMFAHDVRKPFTLVQSVLDVIDHCDSFEEVKDISREAKNEVAEAVSSVECMISDILSVGSFRELQCEPLDIETMFTDVYLSNSRIFDLSAVSITVANKNKTQLYVDKNKFKGCSIIL